MSLAIRTEGPQAGSIAHAAQALLRDLGAAPQCTPIAPDGTPHRGPLADAVTIIGFLLAAPGFIEDWTGYPARKTARESLRAFRNRLEELDGDATLIIPGRPPLDLRRASTDAIWDALAAARRA